MAVLEAAEAPADFHAIRDAVRKRYRYVIHDGPVRDVFRRHYVWHYVYGRLDAEAMQRAAAALLGTHDFAASRAAAPPRKTSVRTIFELASSGAGQGSHPDLPSPFGRGAGGEAGGECRQNVGQGRGEEQDFITIEIEANGFLYNMVRAIVGTLVQVGRGVRPEGWPAEVLAAADRRAGRPDRAAAGAVLDEGGVCRD